MRKRLKTLLAGLVLYLDDALFLGGCVCFVRAAQMRFGEAAAVATAGTCLVVWALLIARSRKR